METGTLLQPHELAGLDRQTAESAIRSRCRAAYLGDHVALSCILGRHKFFIDTRDVGFGSHVVLDGFWEIWLTLFSARNVKASMTAIDVGAHYGYYSILFADLVGNRGQVIAVEPNPRAGELWQRSIDLNGFGERARLVCAAADADDGAAVTLFVPHGESKNALIVDTAEGLDQRGTTLEVPSLSLDGICRDLGPIDFIKIDAEGSEERILAGMPAVIARGRPMIVIEFNAARYRDAAAFVDRLFAVYGQAFAIGFDGAASLVGRTDLLTRNFGEDWLVVLSDKCPA
jgi:FkbM family methyltransferase